MTDISQLFMYGLSKRKDFTKQPSLQLIPFYTGYNLRTLMSLFLHLVNLQFSFASHLAFYEGNSYWQFLYGFDYKTLREAACCGKINKSLFSRYLVILLFVIHLLTVSVTN